MSFCSSTKNRKNYLRQPFSTLLVVFICLFYFQSCSIFRESRLKAKGIVLANQIEEFRIHKKRLPQNLGELGIKETEEGPLYYKKVDESKYVIWFGMELGESVTYDSETRKWNP